MKGNISNNDLAVFFEEITLMAAFVSRFFKEFFKPPYEPVELIRQSFFIGYKSLSLVAITGFIMGLVLTVQSRPTLVKFGAESWLPAMISVSIVREIAPMLTALICAGKVGSGIGAELASMKVTEQIEAMEVSAINPFKFLVVTRVLACTLALPVLVVFSEAVSLYGSFVGINLYGEVSFPLFFSQAMDILDFSDIMPAFIKSFFFGFAIGIIGAFYGFNSANGTVGVGKAANTSVIIASLMVFFIDMVAVQVTNAFGY